MAAPMGDSEPSPHAQTITLRALWSASRRRGLRLRNPPVALIYPIPVDHLLERGEVLGAAVLVLEIVGVLPDIDAEQRGGAGEQRRVLVGRGIDGKLAFFHHQPGPAAAENFGRLFGEQLPEI